MSNLDFKNYLKEKISLVDLGLKKYLPDQSNFPETIFKSMEYSLFAGGKRVRPILSLATAEALNGSVDQVMPIACALEMIHTFSLVHDDLPSMDNDDLRRGKPTNHKVFGESTAILAGDGLVIQAFELLAENSMKSPNPKAFSEIIFDIARATGPFGMIGGQIVDMESEGKPISENELEKLHQLKTGRLITVSVLSGAKLFTDDQKALHALKDYGDLIGLAFQVADDILDIEGGEEIGKDIGSDQEKGKATYPSIIGLDQAKIKLNDLRDQAKEKIDFLGESGLALKALADYIVERTN
jgi:geranylgeranyl diphosphate synthase type II